MIYHQAEASRRSAGGAQVGERLARLQVRTTELESVPGPFVQLAEERPKLTAMRMW